jgi:hypothetical protein
VTSEHQPKKVYASYFFTAVKTSNGMYDVCSISFRPSEGADVRINVPARDLPEFERLVRQATTEHRKAVEEEKAVKLRAAESEIQKLAVALSAPARTNGGGWVGLSPQTQAEYTKQAEALFAEGWRRNGEYLK